MADAFGAERGTGGDDAGELTPEAEAVIRAHRELVIALDHAVASLALIEAALGISEESGAEEVAVQPGAIEVLFTVGDLQLVDGPDGVELRPSEDRR